MKKVAITIAFVALLAGCTSRASQPEAQTTLTPAPGESGSPAGSSAPSSNSGSGTGTRIDRSPGSVSKAPATSSIAGTDYQMTGIARGGDDCSELCAIATVFRADGLPIQDNLSVATMWVVYDEGMTEVPNPQQELSTHALVAKFRKGPAEKDDRVDIVVELTNGKESILIRARNVPIHD